MGEGHEYSRCAGSQTTILIMKGESPRKARKGKQKLSIKPKSKCISNHMQTVQHFNRRSEND